MGNSPDARICRVIAVTNNKGGVGKTTSAVAIGSILRMMGYEVLLVDLDPQANLTAHLTPAGTELVGAHIGDVLSGAVPIGEVVLTYKPGTNAAGVAASDTSAALDFIPASYEMNMQESGIQKRRDYFQLLRTSLRVLRPHYDFILLDTPPSLQTYTIMALVAADAYLVPAEPERFSYEGLKAIMDAADNVKDRLNPSLELLGIFFTRYNPKMRNSTHKLVIENIEQQYGGELLLANIRKDSALVKAQVAAQSIQHYAPDSNASADYHELTAQLLTRLS